MDVGLLSTTIGKCNERIPDHLMISLKLEEGRMWRGGDGRFVVQYNRGREIQTFSYRMEEHMDMLSGTIDRS